MIIQWRRRRSPVRFLWAGLARDGAERPGAHDVAQDAGLGAEVVPGRHGS